MARKDPIPQNDAEAAEYLDGVAWAGAHADATAQADDQHATDLAKGGTGDDPRPSLFHRS